MSAEVNIPLLRKAVEWAEAEAMKPPELCEWEQNYYEVNPHEEGCVIERPNMQDGIAQIQKAPECGTCFCIAGFVAVRSGHKAEPFIAGDLLGLKPTQASELFYYGNNIEDVRRIAEEIAGERL